MQRFTYRRISTLVAALCFATCWGTLLHAAPKYDLTILRPLAGKTTSAAQFGVNDRGMSVGTSGGQGGRIATLWNRNGAPVALARPSNSIFSRASAINERGVVVGAIDTTGQPDLTGLRAVRWKSPNRYEFILPETGYDSDALSINDEGWVAGILFNGSVFTAFIASPRGHLDYPAPLNNGDAFELLSINRRHEGAGFNASESETTAVRWSTRRGLENLGRLPGGTTSAAASINDRGVVGGVADDATGVFRAVRWDADGRIIELESLRNAIYSDSQMGINNFGFSVGITVFDGSDLDDPLAQRATLWTPGGRAFDLNRLVAPNSGITLLTANGISDTGMIYGDCVDAVGHRFAFLLGPNNRGD